MSDKEIAKKSNTDIANLSEDDFLEQKYFENTYILRIVKR